ncbi:MAG: hypothetical protein S4CHLAM102_13830 [Chlamydiia bacterium]|nr:hypothetical protein [Chlamydiia bacterium]
MAHPKLSYRQIRTISSSLFLIGLAAVTYLGDFWPGILLAIGVPLVIRQFLMGKYSEAGLSFCIYGGLFAMFSFSIQWSVILPILFTISALFLLLKEFFNPFSTNEVEDEESTMHEIEIEIDKDHKHEE